mmetsp:Transcript_4120/g.18502  ORF Transcript_4120/g.18502 Transcript_4120/m.18502 type:complete len:289 (-) Transcript_4120:76-942(-)
MRLVASGFGEGRHRFHERRPRHDVPRAVHHAVLVPDPLALLDRRRLGLLRVLEHDWERANLVRGALHAVDGEGDSARVRLAPRNPRNRIVILIVILIVVVVVVVARRAPPGRRRRIGPIPLGLLRGFLAGGDDGLTVLEHALALAPLAHALHHAVVVLGLDDPHPAARVADLDPRAGRDRLAAGFVRVVAVGSGLGGLARAKLGVHARLCLRQGVLRVRRVAATHAVALALVLPVLLAQLVHLRALGVGQADGLHLRPLASPVVLRGIQPERADAGGDLRRGRGLRRR